MDRRRLFGNGFKNFGSLMRDVVHEHKKQKRELAKGDTTHKPAEFFRPPYAIAEPLFLDACTRCNDCQDACPEGSIYKHFAPSDNTNLTPVMEPNSIPCAMCEDTPCVTACEEGALVKNEEGIKVGLARIYIDNCATWTGVDPECNSCLDLCPLPEKALHLDKEGRMRVRNSICDGCGHCVSHCPEGPMAIEIVPLTESRKVPTE